MSNKVRAKINVTVTNSDASIRNLKRKMQRELIFRKLKMIRSYEPPSEKKVRKREESRRRILKLNRKKSYEED